MDLFIKEHMRFFGSNLKDDFYATVNKALNNFEIKPGRLIAGNAYSLDDTNTERINDFAGKYHKPITHKGTKRTENS